jgi:hypothetical protein
MAYELELLVLYDVVESSRIVQAEAKGKLKREEEQWHFGLRQTEKDAWDRLVHMNKKFNQQQEWRERHTRERSRSRSRNRLRLTSQQELQESHVVLKVVFYPAGVAYFATAFQDKSYQFKPVLHKMSYRGWKDWGAWRFLDDLPLRMDTAGKVPMVKTQWQAMGSTTPAPSMIMSVPLVLYILVEYARAEQAQREGCLKKESGKGHIALRASLQDAVDRAIHFDEIVDKQAISHVVLVVTFHPLGVAHFGTRCQDCWYEFKPYLHKMDWCGHKDSGAWRFLDDLPLFLQTSQEEFMVTTEWNEIE